MATPTRTQSCGLNRVVINVGGRRFLTYKSTLKAAQHSLLAKLDHNHPSFDIDNQEYYFDRNPLYFECILDYCRGGELHFPNSLCGPSIQNELLFWGIQEACISDCCLRCFVAFEDEKQTLGALERTLEER